MTAELAVLRLESRHEAAYRAMLRCCAQLPLQAGLEYRRFLQRVLPHAEERYLVAVTPMSEVVGALPAFLARPPGHPAILNALPFFGSHGGPYVAENVTDRIRVQRALLEAYLELAKAEAAAASTLVTNPLDKDVEWFSDVLDSTGRDWRIGQISMLPQGVEPEDSGERLMAGFHQKTRNAVRKGLKAGYRFRIGGSDADFEALRRLHLANMKAIGAPAKPAEVFAALRAVFPPGVGSQLYLAEANGETVAGLLVLLSDTVVEYFTPAVAEAHRGGQPLSALIFIAMRDAVKSRRRMWNWGGTHPSLTDLYRFKARWGAEDHRYHYFTTAKSRAILGMPREHLAKLYPYFYVVPYAALEGA